ncbi:Epimerase family protein [Anaerolineae bacterium]|nr:Epimerase family protein [Anaerolineae bacterium]
MKKVIITGGTGFIGRALASSLTKDGYQIIVLSRQPANVSGLPAGVQIEQWDARTGANWSRVIDRDTAIINLAGENIGDPPLPWWLPGRKERIRTSRINAGRAVVDAVQAASEKPTLVIQASGINYYGLSYRVVSEQDPAGADFMARVCVEWEASTAPVETLGVRRIVIRTAPVLAGKGGLFKFFALPFRLFVGGPLGDGKQWLSWIHLDDQVGAIRFLLENKNARGIYNLTAPNPLTNSEFGRVLGRVLKRPYWFPTPAFALKLAFGELGTVMVLGSQRVLPQRLLDAGYEFKFADAESTVRDVTR